MRRAVLLLAALAVLVTGCGDDTKIPRDDAAELRAALLEAKRRLDPLRCGDLEEDSLPKLEERAATLPEGSDVRDTIEDGIEHLRTLVEAECTARDEEREETTTTTEPETTTTTPPETTTQPPETTPPPETTQPPDTTPPPETTPPPDNDGNGNGNGNGGQQAPSGAVKPKKRDKEQQG